VVQQYYDDVEGRPLLGARSKFEMSGTRMFCIINVAHDNCKYNQAYIYNIIMGMHLYNNIITILPMLCCSRDKYNTYALCVTNRGAVTVTILITIIIIIINFQLKYVRITLYIYMYVISCR